MKGVSPSFLAELQSKTINSPQKKQKKQQELTLASRVMVLSLQYLLKYWPHPGRTRLRTSWKTLNLRLRINIIELPRPLSGPRMCSGHSRCSRAVPTPLHVIYSPHPYYIYHARLRARVTMKTCLVKHRKKDLTAVEKA